MGCLSSKSSEASRDQQDQEDEPKVYSWDKRKKIDKELFQVKNKHGIDNSVFRNDVEDLPITIEDCSDCIIFLLGVTKNVTIDECKNLKIICFSADSVYIRNSQDISLLSACGQYRCRDCRRLNLFLHCSTQPVIESSQKVKTAPFLLDFDGIENTLQNLKISKFSNSWNKIHDFGPVDTEPNWEISENVVSQLDDIFSQFGNMFISAPVVRSTHSYYPIVCQTDTIIDSELSFVIFAGPNSEDLATSCYHKFTQDTKKALLLQSNAGKLNSISLPERAKKQLYDTNGTLIGLLFQGNLSAIDYSAFADPGQSYFSFHHEAKSDSETFFASNQAFH